VLVHSARFRRSAYDLVVEIVHVNLCNLTVSRNSAAVVFGTFDSRTPALSMPIGSGQGGYSLAVDRDCLCVIPSGIAVFV
jgi:hypothetical protein